ncbi:MarR family winged helix-turn-helix transcriptional regulator [Anaerostipes sp.]|uniref:MarR family winged helix-turn-helix transcriptional regulator n=1 Tax=Anaerostipes sp. TaxID=1872530 RepID=UPI0025BD32F3|nr:MarR family winged helix-turn-helix transcriptional regulator [Anaerostipes sp.]MBS7007379.1 winged helix-turn-helix transcriptional regulator [Anaerostipes sp.]
MQNHILTYANHFKHLYRQSFQPLSEQYGLSQLEIDILLFLRNNPEHNTAKDISSMRGFAKSNVSKAVESLRVQGYLSSFQDPDNRKVHRLTLCSDMEDRIISLSVCQEQCFALLLDGFTAEERCMLQRFFDRIDANITKSLNHKKYEL